MGEEMTRAPTSSKNQLKAGRKKKANRALNQTG
jgi:hypothetical protein